MAEAGVVPEGEVTTGSGYQSDQDEATLDPAAGYSDAGRPETRGSGSDEPERKELKRFLWDSSALLTDLDDALGGDEDELDGEFDRPRATSRPAAQPDDPKRAVWNRPVPLPYEENPWAGGEEPQQDDVPDGDDLPDREHLPDDEDVLDREALLPGQEPDRVYQAGHGGVWGQGEDPDQAVLLTDGEEDGGGTGPDAEPTEPEADAEPEPERDTRGKRG